MVGLKTYKEALKNYETEKDYYENLKYHLTNFEEIINSKKSKLQNTNTVNKVMKVDSEIKPNLRPKSKSIKIKKKRIRKRKRKSKKERNRITKAT